MRSRKPGLAKGKRERVVYEFGWESDAEFQDYWRAARLSETLRAGLVALAKAVRKPIRYRPEAYTILGD